MANEELLQRGYMVSGKLKGGRFGDFEELNIGGTTVEELKRAGVDITIPSKIRFPFQEYKAPKKPGLTKPDRLFFARIDGKLVPIACAEHKSPTKSRTIKQQLKAAEQALHAAAVIGAPIAVSWQGPAPIYIDVNSSIKTSKLMPRPEHRDLTPGVLASILRGDAGVAKDPAPLAESVWQIIWHATKEEPKECLLTFVEIFVLKFLSDNLPLKTLPQAYRFDALLQDPKAFKDTHGTTAIEYYVSKIRPFIKILFPDNTVASDPQIAATLGLHTVVSKTSVINGFAFLKSSIETLSGFNRTFLEILNKFHDFGPLTTIDPEFKLRLYETFLRRSARQQKLGQFFTPRNVVRPMIRMANLDALPDNAVVLDPAAGVGGFILEPALLVPSLKTNVAFAKGKVTRRIKLIGIDVDANTHILAKANTLIHFAEAVRDPSTTMPALNQLMAETFVLMNTNETLGSLATPPQGTVDVILTNPPYVTKGSAVYKDEVKEVGVSANGVDLPDYYDRAGLGVESLFLRYIAGALKPGGRALVIVPLGLLNRTEPGPKKRILDECNLLASISLPRNTFFNTAQLTYILILEKRFSTADERPDIFCGIASSIGETLNAERVPTPEDNDLDQIATMFVSFASGDHHAVDGNPIAKIVPADQFTENDRWDVERFWTEEELVDLGRKQSAVSRLDFIDEVSIELQQIASELAEARKEIEALTSTPTIQISVGDTSCFVVRSGTRVRAEDIRNHPGNLPVYSCFKTEREIKGSVCETYFSKALDGVVEKHPIVTVNANGASVGRVFVRRDKCALTDDVIIVQPLQHDLDLDYLAVALRAAVDKGGFLYEAKLFAERVRGLSIDVPVDRRGLPDVKQQRAIATSIKRFETLRTRLHDLGVRSNSVRAV